MSDKINIAIMGFGHIGRYLYENTLNSDIFNVKIISDIGNIDSLNYLLNNNLRNKNSLKLDITRDTQLYIFAYSINILRVMSGMAGLAYSN